MATPLNIYQIYTNNPITTNASTDLMYFGQSPYGITNDAAMTYANFAAQFISKDANGNVSANNFLSGYATTATAAATTTLTVASKYQQYFTGSTTQIVLLPVTSTLVLGQSFYIVNNSSGVVTVESSGGNTVKTMAANSSLLVTCILISGTTAASWNAEYSLQNPLTLPLSLANGGTAANLTASNGGIVYSGASAFAIGPAISTAGLALLSGSDTIYTWSNLPPITKINIQVFTVGTSTYTPSAGMQYCTVQIGGGGAASGSVAGSAGQGAASGGGGGGGACIRTYPSTLIGATAQVVVGAGGVPGSAGNNPGGNGANSTFTPAGAGTVLTATGGIGGSGAPSSATISSSSGGAGGTGTGGDINFPGSPGGDGITINGSLQAGLSGTGGKSIFGNSVGNCAGGAYPGLLYGGGASGYQNLTTSNQQGVAGAAGICYITEYISI